MSEQPRDWKAEAAAKRRQRERETDVERRWQEVIDKDGDGAPEWLKEAALKKKAQQDKETGVAPWLKEVRRTNKDLARKISDVYQSEQECGDKSAPVPPAPVPKVIENGAN
ncbi:hypothetical protein FBUS_05257 [Fasciolopsis buskii]|uniref:Uncharacterized protein n=1 Tax=Fasciolopsis buskii TaxID=27845 RepID=A0A8E0RM51_9TREM|nr:hypothetical protein FBUS_05257 [Fasciolopsis buski]